MRKPNVIRKLTVSKFIDEELDSKIGKLIGDFPFLSFSLICMGIEFLGNCIDDKCEFSDKRKSRQHFEKCIRKYMKQYEEYIGKENEFDLYEKLRCGLAHQFRHDKAFSLAPIDSKDKHLDILSDGKIVLKIDEFYKDFSIACKSVISDISENVLTHEKVHSDYQIITD